MTMTSELDRLRGRFAVLDRLDMPDLEEEVDRRRLVPPDQDHLAPSAAPRRLVPILLGLIAIGLSVGGFVWLRSAFRAVEPPPPAQPRPAEANYVFSEVRVETMQGQAGVALWFRVSWSDGTYPGIHRCVFRVLDEDGKTVAERVEPLSTWTETIEENETGVGLPLDEPSRFPARGEAVCAPERLDTPGIADLEPLDPELAEGVQHQEIGLDVFFRAIDRRTDIWAERFEIGSMTIEQLAANVAALRLGRGRLPGSTEDQGLASWELDIRSIRLCELIPKDDAIYREIDCSTNGPASLE
jgi:hypothetical protein